jgi:hypothetical protein
MRDLRASTYVADDYGGWQPHGPSITGDRAAT